MDETAEFTLFLPAGSSGTVLGGQTAAALIISDDDTSTISVANAQVTEGNVGSVNLNFPVTLSHPSDRTVTVQYATTNGTAQSEIDFAAGSGTLTFAPGSHDSGRRGAGARGYEYRAGRRHSR